MVPERNDEAIDTLNFLLLASFILSKEFLKRGWRLYYCYKKKRFLENTHNKEQTSKNEHKKGN